MSGYATVEAGRATIEIDATGAGEVDITFRKAFDAAPSVMLEEIQADDGNWLIAASSNTLGTVSVTGSDLRSTSITLTWVALAKR